MHFQTLKFWLSLVGKGLNNETSINQQSVLILYTESSISESKRFTIKKDDLFIFITSLNAAFHSLELPR